MRWKTQSLVAGVLTLAWAAPVYACGFWFNSTFLDVPMRPTLGLGLQHVSDFTIIAADVAFKAGDKLVIRPGVGSCRYSGSGGSESEVVYGAAAALRLWNDEGGKVAVNAQVGGEFDSFEGGSERNIPIGGAVQYMATDVVSLFGGAAINLYGESFDDGDSYSHTDESVFAGAALKSGNFTVAAGVTYFIYENNNETAINIGGSMALGGMNAFRALGSLFRSR